MQTNSKGKILPDRVIDAPVKISGTVVDENGLPLPGVSVYEKKSHKGTSTDINGNLSLPQNQVKR
jgi:hypothetical protein